MGDQYRVDLSELESTITKLNGVLKAMGGAQSCATDDTYLPSGALGTDDFLEAKELVGAHDEMRTHILDIIEAVNGMVDRFGRNTKKVHGSYSDAEYDVQAGMSGTGG